MSTADPRVHVNSASGPVRDWNQPVGGAEEARLPMRKLREGKHWTVDHRTNCWNWTGSTNRGYAIHRFGPAHRVVYRQEGHTIPAGNDLHHRCENTLCVNPAHMEPVPKAEHVAAHHRFSSKLDWDKVRRMREMRWEGFTLQQIADTFGIGLTDTHYVCRNLRWHDPEYTPPVVQRRRAA